MNEQVRKLQARSAELEKELAEVKRELEIEAALEEVRARSLAMHHSDELKEVVAVLFDRLVELGLSFDGALIFLFDKETQNIQLWIATVQLPVPVKIDLPFDEEIKTNAIIRDLWDAVEKGEHIFNKSYSGKTKNDYFHYVQKYNESKIPDWVKRLELEKESWTGYFVAEQNSMLGFDSWSGPISSITHEDFRVLSKFAKVFEQAYTRFLDLQKAEAQAREAQIEVGLERVRARAMAMQRSDELRELIATVSSELGKLDIVLDRSFIITYDTKTMGSTWWMANPETPSEPTGLFVKYHEQPPYLAHIEAWKQRRVKWEYILEGEVKKTWDKFLFVETELSQLPHDVIENMRAKEKVYLSSSFNNFGYLTLATLAPLTDAQFDIMLRFAKVFDLTYTRFSDLKQAEAQAREAQIQLALERVRARTMAMQRSDELAETVAVLFEQLKQLGEAPERAFIGIVNEAEHVIELWTTQHGGMQLNMMSKPSIDEPYVMKPMYEAWKQQKKNIVIDLQGNELEAYFHYIKSIGVPVDRKAFGERRIDYVAFFSKGMLGIITQEQRPVELLQIVERFATVFDLTYTRFLDLQKAEEQARESQIEAALERVRASAMAMHTSGDLFKVAEVLHEQLSQLGNKQLESSIIHLYPDQQPNFEVWYSYRPLHNSTHGLVQDHMLIPKNMCSWTNEVMAKYQSNEVAYTIESRGEMLAGWYHVLEQYAPATVEHDSEGNIRLPEVLYYHFSKFSGGALLMISDQPPDEEAERLQLRAARVFELAYRRFKDLEQAEAQAREAKIEAALERVRSRSMAMQKSDELREVIQVIFDQLSGLHFNIDSASFTVEIHESNDMRLWVAAPRLQYASRVDLPYLDHPIFNKMLEARAEGETFTTLLLTKDEKDRFFDYYFRFVPIPDERKKFIYNSEGWAQSSVLMNSVALTIQNYSGVPFSEEHNRTLIRFGKAFEQTYIRFIDLQKAESATKEAIKQASVDRVRAEIASMRTTQDLERIIPLVWNELTSLNIPFIRCGVFIMHEGTQQTQVYLSTPDGRAIAAFQIPFESNGFNQEMLQHWRNNQTFLEHWDAAAFSAWTHSLLEAGVIQPDERYSNEKPPENLYLHFVPFVQGMLYVGNTAPLSEEALQLVQSLAGAFATAYARYEDFKKLETAKQQIEIALSELKSTQAQLIQSEKMASLGELTAGIAHEIQNPLNFVNNFSEVNEELISELMEEVTSGNTDEVKAIAGSIKENLEKINHHGKRADAIVKGMLQHSRTNTGQKEPIDLNKSVEEYLRLAYHGFRAKEKSFNAKIETHFDDNAGKINVVPQEIGRVLLNMFNNAFYAVHEQLKKLGTGYEPTVLVTTKKLQDKIEITVQDNGMGISKSLVEKIFQPFFTTKPTGQGTGLGLSLSYDIIKAHNGEIKVESKEGEGTAFMISLPSSN